VKCREMRKADMELFSSGAGFDTDLGSAFDSSSGNICYSMEIKDTILPPWVVSGICSAMSLDASNFDLRYAQSPPPDAPYSNLGTYHNFSHFVS
jgi:protein downstream neighbor of Son